LGIYGLGRIGEAVARRAIPFGLRVLYHNRRPRPDLEKTLGIQYAAFDDLAAQSDFLSINAPLTPETHHRFTLKEFGAMKPTAVLINTGRGPIVKEADLAEALAKGMIGGAALDVYEFEPQIHPGLLDRPNVVLAPHIGSATRAVRDRMARMVAENVAAFLGGTEPPNRVV
jgi:glyoxylate reductase